MRYLLTLVVAWMLAFALVSCGTNNTTAPAPDEPDTITNSTPTAKMLAFDQDRCMGILEIDGVKYEWSLKAMIKAHRSGQAIVCRMLDDPAPGWTPDGTDMNCDELRPYFVYGLVSTNFPYWQWYFVCPLFKEAVGRRSCRVLDAWVSMLERYNDNVPNKRDIGDGCPIPPDWLC